jgi:phenylacetic acid degradation operon negative regulatory protein
MMQDSNTPLTARSVLASALLGEDPPELPVAHLVQLAGLFGISGNRARVALSRMVAAGEATTDGNGRYRLAGHLLDRLGRQTGSRRGETRPWEGGWRLVVVTTSGTSGRAPDERLARRKQLTLARLAELREGVWLRPDNIDLVPDPSADPHLTVFTAVPEDDPEVLAAGLWDLGGWTRRAQDLLDRLDRLPPTGPDDLAPGFELSAAVLRHLQADPLLPPELLPDGWPGAPLRAAYERWDRQYREVLTSWGRGDPRTPDL